MLFVIYFKLLWNGACITLTSWEKGYYCVLQTHTKMDFIWDFQNRLILKIQEAPILQVRKERIEDKSKELPSVSLQSLTKPPRSKWLGERSSTNKEKKQRKEGWKCLQARGILSCFWRAIIYPLLINRPLIEQAPKSQYLALLAFIKSCAQ